MHLGLNTLRLDNYQTGNLEKLQFNSSRYVFCLKHDKEIISRVAFIRMERTLRQETVRKAERDNKGALADETAS